MRLAGTPRSFTFRAFGYCPRWGQNSPTEHTLKLARWGQNSPTIGARTHPRSQRGEPAAAAAGSRARSCSIRSVNGTIPSCSASAAAAASSARARVQVAVRLAAGQGRGELDAGLHGAPAGAVGRRRSRSRSADPPPPHPDGPAQRPLARAATRPGPVHGTTGVADMCAPSRDASVRSHPSAHPLQDPFARASLRACNGSLSRQVPPGRRRSPLIAGPARLEQQTLFFVILADPRVTRRLSGWARCHLTGRRWAVRGGAGLRGRGQRIRGHGSHGSCRPGAGSRRRCAPWPRRWAGRWRPAG